MTTQERGFYSSENGDEWLLVLDGGSVAVAHRPNAASGGKPRTLDLATFLSHERNMPQNQALHGLIATLVTDQVQGEADGEADLLDAMRSAD